MWPFQRSTDAPKPLVERIESVEDDVLRLERRFTKLQNEFNASARRQAALERENDELNEELASLDQGGE